LQIMHFLHSNRAELPEIAEDLYIDALPVKCQYGSTQKYEASSR